MTEPGKLIVKLQIIKDKEQHLFNMSRDDDTAEKRLRGLFRISARTVSTKTERESHCRHKDITNTGLTNLLPCLNHLQNSFL